MTNKMPTRTAELPAIFEWIAEICVRFHHEYQAEQGVGAHLLAIICADPDDPDPGTLPPPEQSARSALEAAILTAPLPAKVFDVLAEAGIWTRLDAGRSEQSCTRHSVLREAPGAVEALQAVLRSSKSPLNNIACDPEDPSHEVSR